MKRIVFVYVLCGLVLAGCDDKVNAPENDDDVLVYISTNPLSEVKSAATADEDMISRLILYGVDDKNMVVDTFSISQPSLEGVRLSISKTIKSLYAIANPSAVIQSAIPPSLSDLLNLTGDFTDAPQSPFLMGGKGDVVGSTADIELVRAVAKIEVSALNEFEIESVAVQNTPDKGYVFKKETIAAPTSGRVSYPANTTNSIVYVAENSKSSPTKLLVIGTYLGKRANYTIELTSGGKAIDIVRNTYYKVGVSAVTDVDCTFTITIPEWEDKKTDDHVIPD